MKDIDVYREPTHFFSEWAENSNDYLQILDLYTKECWETWQMSVPWPKSESVKVLVTQLCLILCDSVDCSTPGSSVHGILQARIWSGLPFPSPGDLPNPGIKPRSPALQAEPPPSNKNVERMVLRLRGAQSTMMGDAASSFSVICSLSPRKRLEFPKLQSFAWCFTHLSKSSLFAHYFSFSPLASYFSTFSG